jgi:hyperosmotically inducible protein
LTVAIAALAVASAALLAACGPAESPAGAGPASPVEPAPAQAQRDEQKARAQLARAAEKIGGAASAAVEAVQSTVEDAAITTHVNGAIAKDTALSALHVDVDTHEGHVSLSGQAPSIDARDRATRLAAGVDGVKSVDNRLEVKP